MSSNSQKPNSGSNVNPYHPPQSVEQSTQARTRSRKVGAIAFVLLALIWTCYFHSVFGFDLRRINALAMITIVTVVGDYLWTRVTIALGSLLVAISSVRLVIYYSAYSGPHVDTFLVAGIAFLVLLASVQLLRPSRAKMSDVN